MKRKLKFMKGTERHTQDNELTKIVFRQIIDEPKEIELLLSLFPVMKKYKYKNIKFVHVNCKFVMKHKGERK